MSLALALRSKRAVMPAAILSVAPWYDMELNSGTIESNAGNDKLLSRPVLERFRESWLGGTGVTWNDPRVNLLYADLTGLPPIQVYYGDHELFVGEAIEFANRAKNAGADVSLRSVPEGQHDFILAAGRLPEVDRVINLWLPTLDAFRTFATECPSGVLPGFLSTVSGQTEVRA